MPRGLAIETSGRVGSIALSQGGEVLIEDLFPHGLKHAAELIPRINALCRARQWKPREIEEIYVSVGPGSFTGLRIAITLAKTLAFAIGAKVVAVPTGEALAQNAPGDARHVIIVLDAKRDRIYTARLHRIDSAGWRAEEGPLLDTLAGMLARSPRPVFLIGEGIPHHEAHIPRDDVDVIVTPPEIWRCRAGVVARIGYGMGRDGKFADPDRLTPLYIRRPEAEEKFEQSEKR